MEEQLHTIAVYELSDRHGRFLAWEIHAPGRRVAYTPTKPAMAMVKHRECVFHRTRASQAQPDAWERVFA